MSIVKSPPRISWCSGAISTGGGFWVGWAGLGWALAQSPCLFQFFVDNLFIYAIFFLHVSRTLIFFSSILPYIFSLKFTPHFHKGIHIIIEFDVYQFSQDSR